FQAEEGIRVFHVTGVQTCALPILVRACCNPYMTCPTAACFAPSRKAASAGGWGRGWRPRHRTKTCSTRRRAALSFPSRRKNGRRDRKSVVEGKRVHVGQVERHAKR